jgi:hypothetical protein
MTDYRRIYEKAFGITWDRKLYEVHHIDQNRQNNDISNLLLLPKELHQRLHYRLYSIELIKDMTLIEVIRTLASKAQSTVSMCYYDLSRVIDYMDEVSFWVMLKEFRYSKERMRSFNVEGIETLG